MSPQLEAEVKGVIAQIEHGWCWEEKALAMAELIVTTKPKVVVEIGVFGGKSLIPQALAVRDNKAGIVYGIDSWRNEDCIEDERDELGKEWWSNLRLHEVHRYAVEQIWKFGMEKWCVLIRAQSQHCARLFNQIDILHIDGCHSEVASCRDVDIYLPRVVPGGYVWFDDTNWGSTNRAVALMDARCVMVQEIAGGNTCRLYQKRQTG